MDKRYLPFQEVKFRWSYSAQPPHMELTGNIITDDGDQVAVRVVDANMMSHIFHVMKKDIL